MPSRPEPIWHSPEPIRPGPSPYQEPVAPSRPEPIWHPQEPVRPGPGPSPYQEPVGPIRPEPIWRPQEPVRPGLDPSPYQEPFVPSRPEPIWHPSEPIPGPANQEPVVDGLYVSQQYEHNRNRRMALERELEELTAESARGKQVLDSLDDKIRSLREQVERQRMLKPSHCSSCQTVSLQVDAAAQSLLGSAGHVARTLLRDPNADRLELLRTVLRYVEPVKHLDPELDELYAQATGRLQGSAGAWPISQPSPTGPTGYLHTEPSAYATAEPSAYFPAEPGASYSAAPSAYCESGDGPFAANDEVGALCAAVRDDAQLRAEAEGHQGMFMDFSAVSFKRRRVRGGAMQYLVKVRVGHSKVTHLLITTMPGGEPPMLEKLRTDVGLAAPLDYF